MDCTGCQLCVEACGDEALVMKDFEKMKEQESGNWEYAMSIPNKGDLVGRNDVRSVQFHQPAAGVQRSVRRMRRDAVREADHATVR